MKRELIGLLVLGLLCCHVSGLMSVPNMHPQAKKRLSDLDKIFKERLHPSTSSEIPEYTTAYFTNWVDHFDFHNEDTYLMRYLYNDDNWNPDNNDPIFIYCGNEDDIVSFWNNSGFLTVTLREEFNALVLFPEHRYFGLSMPYGDNSYETANLKQLTVAQAMADYADFITSVKEDIFGCEDCPIIAFGGSYGGMLSAWMRFKYPHLIDGSIACSAPIIFRDTPYAWMETVTDDYSQAAEKLDVDCVDLIRKGFDIMGQQNDTSGWEELDTSFNLCPESLVTSYEDVEALQEWVAGAMQTLAMLDYPYSTDFLAPIPGNPVDVACDEFQGLDVSTSTDDEILAAMLNTANIYYPPTDDGCNYPFEEESIENNSLFGWDILACTSMVFPIGTNNVTDMFPPIPWDLESYSQECLEDFDVQTRADWAMTYFGGLQTDQLLGYSNIFFSNGDLDPWKNFGLVDPLTDNLITFQMDGAAHHLDLRLPNSLDPEAVVEGRNLERQWIQTWIDEKQELIERLGKFTPLPTL